MVGDETVVLLGAGASVEAGVPTSVELTKAIVRGIESSSANPWAAKPGLHALNVAIASMVAHDTARGGGAYDGIDVERLFSAIEMLADRDKLEIAPFVTEWNKGLDGLPRSTSAVGRELASAITALTKVDPRTGRPKDPSAHHKIERAFISGVRELIGGYDASAFKQLQTAMIEQLRTCLYVEDGASDYLAPLLDTSERPIRIATLNYDRSIETVAGSLGLTVATGLSEWQGSFEWAWPDDSDVNLLKLHGSLNWTVATDYQRTGDLAASPGYFESQPGDVSRSGNLGVIFGQRGKVRSDGPYTAMLREFDSWIGAAKRIVVVGYSFRDEHINRIIRNRFSKDPNLSITLIDPHLPDPANTGRFAGAERDFRSELVFAMTEPHQFMDDDGRTRHVRRLRNHHMAIRKPASAGLLEAFVKPAEEAQSDG